MKKPLLILAAIFFSLAVFSNWKQISQLRPKPASGKSYQQFLCQELENQIIQNAQNDLDMLWQDYSFKIGCLNAVHNITRQERQARFDEITSQYEQIVKLITSQRDAELQSLDIQIQKEKEKFKPPVPFQN